MMGTTVLPLMFALSLAVTTTVIKADAPRPRGVSLAKSSLYIPRSDKSWVCLDGKKSIRFLQINDDFCDCEDGSDEPGTAACTQGHFHCGNVGYRPHNIPSSRVNDGICDCCDSSDEWSGQSEWNCQNNCEELGRAEKELRKNEAEIHRRGATKRSEMISRGKQMKVEREARRAELEHRRSEQETLKTEKEVLKRNAEAAETDALELYKEHQYEQEVTATKEMDATKEETRALHLEAEDSFMRYDTNKDDFVEFTELQVDMTLDRDRNGIVTVEEAKYFLGDHDRIDLDAFITLSWPRIKPIQMLAQGIFKPPEVNEEESKLEQEQRIEPPVEDLPNKQQEEPNRVNSEETEEEEDTYEDEGDVDMGVGSVVGESTPDYDPETRRLIELANEARSTFAEIEREIDEIKHEITEIDDQTAKGYGPNEEYASLDGECFSFEDREYVYTLCPFDRATQKQRTGGVSETTLGRWDQWNTESENKYTKQKYSHGASCWNGPQRSVVVELKCGLEDKITAVSEPNRCEYFFEFETPAACDDVDLETDQGLHDEL